MTIWRICFAMNVFAFVLMILAAVDSGGVHWAAAWFSFSTAYFSWLVVRLAGRLEGAV